MSSSAYRPSWMVNMMRGLTAWKETQESVSGLLPNCVPPKGQRPSMDNVRSYILALFVELGEFLQEFNWKPWKVKEEPFKDKDKLLDEFADILAFVGLIIVYLERFGFSVDDIVAAYAKKTEVNIARLTGGAEGYEANK